jgi:hypothetical protein
MKAVDQLQADAKRVAREIYAHNSKLGPPRATSLGAASNANALRQITAVRPSLIQVPPVLATVNVGSFPQREWLRPNLRDAAETSVKSRPCREAVNG